jgi:signal transduction histidine kinase
LRRQSIDQRAGTSSTDAVESETFSLRLLDTILANMAQGVAVYDADLRLAIYNRRYVELFDYPPELVQIGAKYEDIVRFNVARSELSEDAREAYIKTRVDEARDYGIERHREYRRPNGIVMAIHRGPIPGGGFINTYTDITERKRIEEEEKRHTALLAATLENMTDGVRVFDKDLKLVACNSKSLEMFDYPPELGKIGTPYADFIAFNAKRGDYAHTDDSQSAMARIARARRGEDSGSEYISPDGHIIQKHRAPMPDGGFVSTYHDVTQRKRAQEMLLEAKDRAEGANHAKSEFLANMSHELRTPLNAVIGFSQIMADETLGPIGSNTYRDYAHHIQESGQHLLAIINDILDLSKVEAGKTTLTETPVDLASVAKACLRLMEERATAGNVTLHTDFPARLPLLRADQRLIRQILLNLLSNGVKFTPAGGSVSMTIAVDSGLVLAVADTGIGMADADVPNALAPFMQLDNSLSRKFQGTGLGLPLVASFVRLHDGTLSLRSKPGEGTTVTIWFPPERLIQDKS